MGINMVDGIGFSILAVALIVERLTTPQRSYLVKVNIPLAGRIKR